MNQQKLKYLEDELKKIWDNSDFVLGILNGIDYDEELNELITFVDDNKGKGLRPSEYTRAALDIEYGKGAWENGQLITIVDNINEDDN